MRKRRIGYAASVVFMLLSVVLIWAAYWLYGALRGDKREQSEDISDYRQWSVPEQYTHFLVFPEELPDSAEDVEYYYKYESGLNRPMCQIFLVCSLGEKDYEAEKERLSSLSWTSEAKGELHVTYDAESFSYPAYVTIAGYDFCYEYALLYEQKKMIVYIYAMNTIKEDIKFSEEFLPSYYMEDFDDLSILGLDRFTMYGGYDALLTEKETAEG